MNRKLTLSVDEVAIESGKRFAASNGTSLSRMVETFLMLLGNTPEEDRLASVSPKIMSLVGIGAGPVSEADYRAHLEARNA